MNDPIADMLTRIRNAVRAGHPRVEIPRSGLKVAIAQILKREGYIGDVAEVEKGRFKAIRITLRYDEEGQAFLSGLESKAHVGGEILCNVW